MKCALLASKALISFITLLLPKQIVLRLCLYSGWHEFSPDTEKYGPEKTPYLDIFRAVAATSVKLYEQTPSLQC